MDQINKLCKLLFLEGFSYQHHHETGADHIMIDVDDGMVSVIRNPYSYGSERGLLEMRD